MDLGNTQQNRREDWPRFRQRVKAGNACFQVPGAHQAKTLLKPAPNNFTNPQQLPIKKIKPPQNCYRRGVALVAEAGAGVVGETAAGGEAFVAEVPAAGAGAGVGCVGGVGAGVVGVSDPGRDEAAGFVRAVGNMGVAGAV
jgi:hypothetical protein